MIVEPSFSVSEVVLNLQVSACAHPTRQVINMAGMTVAKKRFELIMVVVFLRWSGRGFELLSLLRPTPYVYGLGCKL